MITERIGYFPGHVNIGIVIGEHGAILIDSGLDTQTSKKIRKGLDAIAQPLCAIIQTHSHADHFGGNAYLLGCWPEAKVYAPPLEEAIIRNPILEPIYLNMGAEPLEDLKNKFLLAQPSRVDHRLPVDEVIEIAGIPFSILSLPGHSWNQVGVVCDEICFAADSYLGAEVLEKHKLPFLVDANETILSLHKLLATNYKGYLPGHGAYTTTSQDAVNQNIAWHERIYAVIEEILLEDKSPEEALSLLCERLQITIENASSYVLFRTAFMGYLVGLQKTKRVSYRFEQNRWLWRTVQDGAEGADK